MSRITDSILEKNTAYTGNSPALDLTYGGQNGFMPKLGMVGPDGKNYEEWINNHAYIKRNVIPVVLTYPKAFDLFPEKEKFISTYKAIMELHPLTIGEFNNSLTVETDEQTIAGTGLVQEELLDVKLSAFTVTNTYKEKAGKAIKKFLNYIIRYTMLDPYNKKPSITRFINSIEDIGGMYTPDFYTGTVLYIEPDITHKVAIDAWLCSNMFPKSDGDISVNMDKTAAGESKDLSIEFATLPLSNEAVIQLAQKKLEELTVLNKIPDNDLVLPVTETDPSVEASDIGYNS
jgi:hypothetical protein